MLKRKQRKKKKIRKPKNTSNLLVVRKANKKEEFKYILSTGTLIEVGNLPNGLHFLIFENDGFSKKLLKDFVNHVSKTNFKTIKKIRAKNK